MKASTKMEIDPPASAKSAASSSSSTPEKFDPNKSAVSQSTMDKFLKSAINEDITSVPGIGPASKKLLAVATAEGPAIETTYQLIGKFLILREPGMTSQEHCDAMWDWLKAKGISSHRSAIVRAIAEKANVMIPGIYEL